MPSTASNHVAAEGGLKRKRLLLLQDVLPPFRRPVFNGLARYYDVTVLHSGTPSASASDAFHEVVHPVRRRGPLLIRDRAAETSAEPYDTTVSMFDLRWPDCSLPPLRDRHTYGRWILWGHGYGRNRLARPVRDWLVGRADGVLLYDDSAATDMLERGVRPHKIYIAPNTVHVANHRDCSSCPKTSLIYVGRLSKAKKVDVLIDAFARIRNGIPDCVRLDIVGDGVERASLERRVQHRGLTDAVTFHGEVQDDEVLAELFSRAFACAVPGYVGLVVLHSFAYGVPVITPRGEPHAPEFHNLAHGSNALISDRRDFADALVEVCTHPERAAMLGRNAYAFYANKRTLDMMLYGFRKAIEGW